MSIDREPIRFSRPLVVTFVAGTAGLLMFLAGCSPCESADCTPRGTVYGGGGVWLGIEMNDGEILELESTGIGEALLGDGQEGDFEYDEATMGESSAFLWSFPGRSTLEAHFEWPNPDVPAESACAAAADELLMMIEISTDEAGGGDSFEVVSQVLSTANELLVQGEADLSGAEVSLDSAWQGEVETTRDHFPHLVDCLGGPSALAEAAALTIRWDFDSETSVDLCRPLGCE